MRHFDRAERRRRLLTRHHLAAPAGSVEQVAGDLVGLHSTDPATVVLALRARLDPFAVADLEDALYERRTLLRMLAMRRTMFVVPLDLAAVMDAACTRTLVPGERRKLVELLRGAGVADDVDAWIETVETATLAALRTGGPLPASQLTKLVPDLALQLKVAVGTAHEGTLGVATRVLFLLAAQGRIARARPLGSWLSSQYRWVAMEDWIGPLPSLDDRDARAELTRRWLRSFGPATVDDLAWWAKWTKTHVKVALADVGAVAVTADTGDDAAAPAWVLADDLDDTSLAGPPPVSLLPALDPTIMGWKHRTWYLGPHRGPLFDRTGNAGPTVWVGGEAVGVWSQRAGGEVVYRLLEDVSRGDAQRIATMAARLTDWMDGVRVTPRFPTPLDRELASCVISPGRARREAPRPPDAAPAPPASRRTAPRRGAPGRPSPPR